MVNPLTECTACGGRMEKVRGTHKGIGYSSYKCAACGEEIFTMEQTKDFLLAAEKARSVTFSRWGEALAVRIPAEVVRKFHLKDKEKGRLVEVKDGFKIIPK